MKKFYYIFVFFAFVFLGACSTQQDSFGNRFYHNMTTKYNVLYNGNLLLDKGIQDLDQQYQDNFWEILPIEPLAVNDDLAFSLEKQEDKKETSFDLAEDKAVKAIQKHGMYINGSERNKQIDDAYFLLGKSRYYSQRFIPALEAFDFTLLNNPSTDLNVLLKIWKAKSQIHLQNEKGAIDLLNETLERTGVKNDEKEQIYTTLAMAYSALDSVPMVVENLKNAVQTDHNPDQFARNWFILGQLYQNQNEIESSTSAFNQVIRYNKSPQKYKVHAYLHQVDNTENAEKLTELKKELVKLSKNPLNKEFLGAIYYGMAQVDFKLSDNQKALDNLKKSIQVTDGLDFQKVLSYGKLGDFYFNHNDFVKASKYYDSILPNLHKKDTRRKRKLDRKIKSLEDVVYYENHLKTNDSIIRLVQMNESEQKTYFDEYISRLKKTDEALENQKQNAQLALQQAQVNPSDATKEVKGKWYFYNRQTVDYGKKEFQRIWGNRVLKDNWRWSTETTAPINRDVTEYTDATRPVPNDSKYDPEYYLNALAKQSSNLKNLQHKKSEALYNLGLIYKEKFQAYPLAKDKLEQFLADSPISELILPAKFHLSEVYQKLGDPNSEKLKSEIIAQDPNSKYAQILLNPDSVIAEENVETPEKFYEKTYQDFENQQYESVLKNCELALSKYPDDPILAKFDLLKAYSKFHLMGKTDFEEGLEYVVYNYPKTNEAEYAQDILNFLHGISKPKIKAQEPVVPETPKVVKPLTEEEKRQKVLEMMKQNPPPDENKSKRK